MLKCITFDGDTSTLNTLMGYFEKLDKALNEVHGRRNNYGACISRNITERSIYKILSISITLIITRIETTCCQA